MTGAELLAELEGIGVRVWEEQSNLHYRAPRGVMTEERLSRLRARKRELLEELRERAAGVRARADSGGRYESFPLTDVQSAYLLGRTGAFPYGGVACHGYGELVFAELDPERLELAWRGVVERHDMLRAVMLPDGGQRVLPEVPPYRLAVRDLRGSDPQRVAAAAEASRADLEQQMHDPAEWPLFELRATLGDDEAILHLSIDFLVADFVSIQLLLEELLARYEDPGLVLPPLEIGFRDYLLAERSLHAGAARERDRAYWWRRLDELPPAPELPTVPAAERSEPRFRRRQLSLDTDTWSRFKALAGAHDVTPSTAVLACYADVIARWSRGRGFTLDVTVLNRLPLHPDVDRLVGDFTWIELLEVAHDAHAPFCERARAIQAQLWDDLDHRLVSGVEVMRELSRRRTRHEALFPIVFTSAIGLGQPLPRTGTVRPRLGYGISQTPQVWIDCQTSERDDGLALNWDVREGVFPEGLADDMFEAFRRLLERLAVEPAAWKEADVVRLPEAQAKRRRHANSTKAPLPDYLLHEPIVARALETPSLPAAITPDRVLTYGELLGRANRVAEWLCANGCRPSEPVAVLMDKGSEQPVAALGALLAGASYLAVDTNQPPARRQAMLDDAGARLVLTQSWRLTELPRGAAAVAVDELDGGAAELPPSPASPDDVAYFMYTSGSSGTPKGVMVSHRSAANTIEDVNRRFGVTGQDRVLALASLGFDLSVYDLFGLLGIGGSLVLPDADRHGDPSHWADLVAEWGITVWNSVPAQMQMLHDYLAAEPDVELPSLRLALLSGDWIPLALPDQIRARIPQCKLVALGGATEAAIWSNFHEIEQIAPEWRSVPYGRPLANQRFHVLDAAGRPSPDWVPGELHIAGDGLALGYTDEQQTRERFFVHPKLRERLYRTGDLGRYLPNGEIEFLGREDLQVKILGHRIELAEIESALQSCPGVGAAAAIVAGEPPLGRRLVGFVEPARRTADTLPRATIGALAAEATAAADESFAGVDVDRYLGYAAALDEAALAAMVATLAGSIGPGPAETLRLEELVDAGVVAPRHRRLVRRWLRSLAAAGLLLPNGGGDGYRLAGPAGEAAVRAAWRRVEELRPPEDEPLLTYFQRAAEALPRVLRGDDPVRLFFPEGDVAIADALYRDTRLNRAANAVLAAVVHRIAAETPARPLRVLEVGGGTGGTTAAVLEALDGCEVEYLFTEVSPFFLNVARERLDGDAALRFGVFDLDLDHWAQGLEANSFDVVLAGDTLHATRSIDATLGRLRELTAPGGWLVFSEMTRDHAQILTSLELMIRLGEGQDFEDFRRGRDVTFASSEEWLAALARAGADTTTCLPEADSVLGRLGLHVFAAGFKGDRERVTRAELARGLAERLPAYMVPAEIRVLDALPLTDNGKVDRRALATRLPAEAARAVDAAGPESELEVRLAGAWTDVLSVDGIGRNDDFFERGGDSLLAAQLAGRLRETMPEAAALFFDDVLRAILDRPTIAELAVFLQQPSAAVNQLADTASPLVPLGGAGERAVRVLVHDGTGTLEACGALVAALAAHGPVAGLVVVDPERYCSLDRRSLVTSLAATYKEVLAEQYTDVHLIGIDFGGVVATEIARHLIETGAPPSSLTVLASAPPGAARDGDDEVATASLEAVRAHDLAPYAGDLTLGLPADEPSDVLERTVDFWRETCLGDVTVVELPGRRSTYLGYEHVAEAAASLVGSVSETGVR